MTNKVLVMVNVPSLEIKLDMFVPVNKKIHTIVEMMKKSLFELSNGSFSLNKTYILYNEENGTSYDMNILVRDTDLRNNSKVILL